MKDQIILIYSYLHGIWRYRWSALVIAWVVALPGWMAVYALPDQYTSQAIMHIDTKSVMRPLLKGLAVESKVESGLAFMKQLLLSRKNLEEVIRDTDMDLDADTALAMDQIVAELTDSIILTEKRGTNIYTLSYQGDSADLAYRVVSKLLNTVIETTISSVRMDTTSAQKFIEEQIAEYEKRLTVAEQRLAEFKRANLGLMPDETGGYYSRLQREQGKLDELRSELRLTERKVLEMRKQLKGETPMLSGSYSAPQATKLRLYRERLEILLTQFTEQHPDVRALRSAIADLQANKEVAEDEFAYTEGGDNSDINPVYQELKVQLHKTSVEVETIKLRLADKEKIVSKLKQSVGVIPEVEAKLAKLNRDYEITRNRHLSFIERRESARLAQEVGQSGSDVKFRIIEPPRVEMKSSGPNRLLLLSGVFIAAVGAGLAWGFLRYLIQPTIIAASQIRDLFDLPVLGSVDLFVTGEHRRRRRLQLTSFLLVFLLLVVSFGGVVVLRGVGSDMLNTLISSRSSAI